MLGVSAWCVCEVCLLGVLGVLGVLSMLGMLGLLLKKGGVYWRSGDLLHASFHLLNSKNLRMPVAIAKIKRQLHWSWLSGWHCRESNSSKLLNHD